MLMKRSYVNYNELIYLMLSPIILACKENNDSLHLLVASLNTQLKEQGYMIGVRSHSKTSKFPGTFVWISTSIN